jgi:hypothetical protein
MISPYNFDRYLYLLPSNIYNMVLYLLNNKVNMDDDINKWVGPILMRNSVVDNVHNGNYFMIEILKVTMSRQSYVDR